MFSPGHHRQTGPFKLSVHLARGISGEPKWVRWRGFECTRSWSCRKMVLSCFHAMDVMMRPTRCFLGMNVKTNSWDNGHTRQRSFRTNGNSEAY